MSEVLRSACPNRRLLYPFCLRPDQCRLPQEGHLEAGGSLAMWCRSRKFMMHECCLYSFFHGESFGSGATHSLCFFFSPHTPKHM